MVHSVQMLLLRLPSRVTAGATSFDRRSVWRLHFYKLTLSTARLAIGPNHEAGQDHPSARLPFMDIVTEERHPWDAVIDVQVGPGGVLLFGCSTIDQEYEQMDFILDWQKGEARGVSPDQACLPTSAVIQG